MSKITRRDIEEAVDRYAPNLDLEEREAFIEWNAKSWEGENWDDAGAWNLASEWTRFRKQNDGHWYTR